MKTPLGTRLVHLLVDLHRNAAVQARFETDAPAVVEEYGLSEEERILVRDGDLPALRGALRHSVDALLGGVQVASTRYVPFPYASSKRPRVRSFSPHRVETEKDVLIKITGTRFGSRPKVCFKNPRHGIPGEIVNHSTGPETILDVKVRFEWAGQYRVEVIKNRKQSAYAPRQLTVRAATAVGDEEVRQPEDPPAGHPSTVGHGLLSLLVDLELDSELRARFETEAPEVIETYGLSDEERTLARDGNLAALHDTLHHSAVASLDELIAADHRDFAPYPGKRRPVVESFEPRLVETREATAKVDFVVVGTGFGSGPVLWVVSPVLRTLATTIGLQTRSGRTRLEAQAEVPVGVYSAFVENTQSEEQSEGQTFEVVLVPRGDA